MFLLYIIQNKNVFLLCMEDAPPNTMEMCCVFPAKLEGGNNPYIGLDLHCLRVNFSFDDFVSRLLLALSIALLVLSNFEFEGKRSKLSLRQFPTPHPFPFPLSHLPNSFSFHPQIFNFYYFLLIVLQFSSSPRPFSLFLLFVCPLLSFPSLF